jgi:hypothetical protein
VDYSYLFALWDYTDNIFQITETLFIIIPFIYQYGLFLYAKYSISSFWSPMLGKAERELGFRSRESTPLLNFHNTPSIVESSRLELPNVPRNASYALSDFEVELYTTTRLLQSDTTPVLYSLNSLLFLKPAHYGLVYPLSKADPAVSFCLTAQQAFTKYTLLTGTTPFYIPQGDFQRLNLLSLLKETFNIHHSLSHQTSALNLLRWAYKYNILHRRSIHNSHKLTSVKRLLSLGYFDFNIVDRNIWFSDQYGRDLLNAKQSKSSKSHDILQTSWKLLYQSTLGTTRQGLTWLSNTPLIDPKQSFQRLSFYEESFFFFLKRSYLFTTLNTHSLALRPALKGAGTDTLEAGESVQPLYQFISSLNSQKSLNGAFIKGSTSPSTTPDAGCSLDRDLVIVNFDKTFWSTLALNPLYNLTRPYNLLNQSLPTFLYKQDFSPTSSTYTLYYSMKSGDKSHVFIRTS